MEGIWPGQPYSLQVPWDCFNDHREYNCKADHNVLSDNCTKKKKNLDRVIKITVLQIILYFDTKKNMVIETIFTKKLLVNFKINYK